MYSYINSKYNRFLYFLLGIYIILVFVFSLLLNDFFVNTKAFSNGDSWEVTGTNINSAGYGTDTRTVRFTSSGRTKAIFYTDREFIALLNQKISASNQSNITATCVMIKARDQDMGGSITSEVVSTSGGGSVPALRGSSLFIDRGSDLYNYFLNKGYELTPISGRSYQVSYYINGTIDNAPYDLYTAEFSSDVQYVDNAEDLYKYLVQSDDTVVNNGDPDSPKVDSQIPTPQKVAIYKNSDSPTLVWSNPKGVSGNNSVGLEIEWKPTLVLTQSLYDVRTITSNDYIDLYKGELLDYNSYCVLLNRDSSPPNVLNSYNTLYDSKPIYSGYNDNHSDDWTDYLIEKYGITNVQRINPLEPSNIFASGTYSGTRVPELSYRIRYYTESGVSDWVYSGRTYDSDNVSGPSQHSSTHFKNASGDSVSNPTYIPNNDNKVIPQNEVDDQNNPDKQKSSSIFDFISGFFDTIISAISAIFDKLKELVDSISNGTGSFFSFFADLFGAFPQLLGIFLLGLVVTVLLRVLGR